MKSSNTRPYTYQRLRDYALWYYFRYYPSNARLLQKLTEKGSPEGAQSVFNDTAHLLQEDEIIASKIDTYIFRNKNYRYIRQKMREKLFPIEAVNKYLGTYEQSGESILDEEFLRKKIQSLYTKGKSTKHILYALGETNADREKIEELLLSDFPESEQEALQTAYTKIQNLSREKVIQKLVTQGFRYNDIKRMYSKSN